LNSNAQWLARRITSLGLSVRRITVVGDDVDEISVAVLEAIQRKPCFIITTGGLGPTFDDKTLDGIAKALGRKLREDEKALEMIKGKYQRYVDEGRIEKFELTPPRIKMAKIPEGAETFYNPVGTAPGVLARHEDVNLVMLPGVPEEMKAIFDGSVEPLLRRIAGNVTFFEASIQVKRIPESDIAPIIDRVMRDNPYVYIKSHPRVGGKVPHLELHLSTTSRNPEEARRRVSGALIQISELIQQKGGDVKPTKA